MARNHHGTAIVLGTRGFLFVGEPGIGKTASALACVAQAKAQGWFAALVSDDQVSLTLENRTVIATSFASITGLAEIRGADIVSVPHIAAAVMDLAVRVVGPRPDDRLAPEDEVLVIPGIGDLPLIRLPTYPGDLLARIVALADQRLQ